MRETAAAVEVRSDRHAALPIPDRRHFHLLLPAAAAAAAAVYICGLWIEVIYDLVLIWDLFTA
jgi:hypothetical protein